MLVEAQSVIIVPGYGLAVAQGQYPLPGALTPQVERRLAFEQSKWVRK